jgi:hypothetical protein
MRWVQHCHRLSGLQTGRSAQPSPSTGCSRLPLASAALRLPAATETSRDPADLAQLMAQDSDTVARDYLEQTREIITWLRQDPRLQTS